MRLDDYLKAIQECPDDFVVVDRVRMNRLTLEHGIYDNWPIFTNADYEKVVEDFKRNPKWRQIGSYKHEDGSLNNIFEYVPGTMIIQIMDGYSVAGCNCTFEESRFHEGVQREHFNMSFCLHPYQEKRIQGISIDREQIIVINEVVDYLRAKNYPLCFPQARNWVTKDSSQIVYWPDELHDRIHGSKK